MKKKLLKINQSKLSLILFILIIITSILNLITLVIVYINSQNNLPIDNQPSRIIIPYVNQEIPADTVINEEMISYISISNDYLIGDYITNIDDIVGKCTTYRYKIPKGSLIYAESIDDCNKTRLETINSFFFLFLNDIDNILTFNITNERKQIYINDFQLDHEEIIYIKENLNKYNFSQELKNSIINMLNQVDKVYQELNVDNNLNYNKTSLQVEYQKLETYYDEYEELYSEEYSKYRQ